MNDNAYSIIGRIAIAAAVLLLLCSVNTWGISATRRRNNMNISKKVTHMTLVQR